MSRLDDTDGAVAKTRLRPPSAKTWFSLAGHVYDYVDGCAITVVVIVANELSKALFIEQKMCTSALWSAWLVVQTATAPLAPFNGHNAGHPRH